MSDLTKQAELKSGANSFKEMILEPLRKISDETCTNPGGRDYRAMVEHIRSAIRACPVGKEAPDYEEGFYRAMAYVLSGVADAMLPTSEWNPIAKTEPAFAVATSKASLPDDSERLQGASISGKYKGKVDWHLSELSFRVQAALALMERAQSYDERDMEMLGVNYLLTGISEDIEEVGLHIEEREAAHV